MVDADGLNIEDFQSQKEKGLISNCFGSPVVDPPLNGAGQGIWAHKTTRNVLFGLLQPYCKFCKLENCYLMFIYLLDFTNIYFLCILHPSRTNELKTFAILIYTPLLPEVHLQSFIFTLPQTFLV